MLQQDNDDIEGSAAFDVDDEAEINFSFVSVGTLTFAFACLAYPVLILYGSNA